MFVFFDNFKTEPNEKQIKLVEYTTNSVLVIKSNANFCKTSSVNIINMQVMEAEVKFRLLYKQ